MPTSSRKCDHNPRPASRHVSGPTAIPSTRLTEVLAGLYAAGDSLKVSHAPARPPRSRACPPVRIHRVKEGWPPDHRAGYWPDAPTAAKTGSARSATRRFWIDCQSSHVESSLSMVFASSMHTGKGVSRCYAANAALRFLSWFASRSAICSACVAIGTAVSQRWTERGPTVSSAR